MYVIDFNSQKYLENIKMDLDEYDIDDDEAIRRYLAIISHPNAYGGAI